MMLNPINRRAFLASASLAALPLMAVQKEVRVGIIGAGSRGTTLLENTLHQKNVRVTAICDIDEGHATRAQNMVEKATGQRPAPYTLGPEDYKRLLERQDVDAVLIMTTQDQHARQAINAMKAGKHVGCETPPAYSLEQCWELVETKEKTGRRYMLLENYPYSRTHMMILNMAHTGVFGDVTYGECNYIHDTRDLAYEKDGSLSWRGKIARQYRGDTYPTHAASPVSLWMGVNRGDRIVSIVSMDTGNKNLQQYAMDHFGKDSAPAQPGFFQRRDTTITMARTAQEKLMVLRYDPGSARPAGGWEGLQGTKAAYDGGPTQSVLSISGRTPDHHWEPLEKYAAEFEHPFWKKEGQEAASAGHGGGDFFVLREFLRAVAEDREPPIDVYDAATWSSFVPLSLQSIQQGKTIEIPDFTKGAWKTRRLTGFGI